MENILTGFLSKTLNLTNEQLSEMLYNTDEKGEQSLKENAIDVLLQADADRVNKLKDKSKEQLDNFHKKGYSEALSKLESDFISTTGHKSEKKGVDLFIEYAEMQKNAKTKLSDDEFKLDKRFIDAERNWSSKIQSEVEKIKSTYEGQLNEFQSQAKKIKLQSEIDKHLSGINIKFPESEKAKINQKNAFINMLQSAYDVDFSEDGNHVVKKGDARLEDAHGNLIAFPDFVKNQASDFFDLANAQKPSNGNQENNGNQSMVKPKNEQEYLQMLKECGGDRDKEIALYKLFKNTN